jgi:hypothetical protein
MYTILYPELSAKLRETQATTAGQYRAASPEAARPHASAATPPASLPAEEADRGASDHRGMPVRAVTGKVA